MLYIVRNRFYSGGMMLNIPANFFVGFGSAKTRISILCHGQNPLAIQKLLDKGMRIRYLLATPAPAYKVVHPNIEYRIYTGPQTNFVLWHFALAADPKMFWLETLHYPGRNEAYNCEFNEPETAKRDSRYPRLLMEFEDMWAHHSAAAEWPINA